MSRLKHVRRAISGLLSVALTGSLCTAWLPAVAAADTVQTGARTQQARATGSIALTLAFDLPQRLDEVKDRAITMNLSGNGKNITVSLKDGQTTGAEGVNVSVEALNTRNVPLTTEQQIGYYQATVSGLPQGTYTMTVSGAGYAACTQSVTLQDYSQHVILSTADGTFSLGDFDGDGAVTGADRTMLSEQLGKTTALDIYDLDGDGVVDVTDLSYVNKLVDVSGTPKVLSTAAIVTATVESTDLIV